MDDNLKQTTGQERSARFGKGRTDLRRTDQKEGSSKTNDTGRSMVSWLSGYARWQIETRCVVQHGCWLGEGRTRTNKDGQRKKNKLWLRLTAVAHVNMTVVTDEGVGLGL